MSQPESATRRLVGIAALTNPFYWLPCIALAQAVVPDMRKGDVRGTVLVVNSDTGRSVVNGAPVRLAGPSSSTQTLTNEHGRYTFTAVIPGAYQMEVNASGLIGSHAVTLAPGESLDVPSRPPNGRDGCG
ncbi:MAG: carboxypeptidase-like regulatory domain-containing protein [Bryobacteraceae bacterium]